MILTTPPSCTSSSETAAAIMPAAVSSTSLQASATLSQAALVGMTSAAIMKSRSATSLELYATPAFVPPPPSVTVAANVVIEQRQLLQPAAPLALSSSSSSGVSHRTRLTVSSRPPDTLPSWIVTPSSKSLRHKLQVDEPLDYDDSTVPVAFSSPQAHMPQVVGHRGALYDALENTREGFLRCADLGCHAVELDVFLLKDDTLIVFHGGGTDENPGDLTDYCLNKSGVNILDLDYAECQKLQFNPRFAEFPCPDHRIESATVPTLEQVLLDLQPTNVKVKIELKGPGTVEPTLRLVEKLDMVKKCEFSSFHLDRLGFLRTLRPQKDNDSYVYQTGALFSEVPDNFVQQALAVGATQVHLRYDTCTVDRIAAIHKAGMTSMAWFRGPRGMKQDVAEKFWDIGNEDASCYQAVIDTGVQQLCCNRPDVLVRMLQASSKIQQPTV